MGVLKTEVLIMMSDAEQSLAPLVVVVFVVIFDVVVVAPVSVMVGWDGVQG